MRTIITLLLLCFSSILIAQKTDDLLLVKYTKEEIKTMKRSQSDKYEFLKFCLTDGFYFVDLPEKKSIKNRISGNVSIANIEEFNFLELNIELLQNDYKYYTVDDKKVLLVVKSIDHINSELKTKKQ
ncbi:MAG: hypothetical protein CL846_04090 [Crocinitomicaceae bacterium]|nr:hypothetical protein [Crocinitomicaceae bacterium]|tara:strand:+ start:12062 stop:12442 length:381 start_codon:yes stop_codon:yes gene_type:complete